jgi:hypothetical protein
VILNGLHPGYEEEIKSYGIERIIKVAIAFDKKDVEIKVK